MLTPTFAIIFFWHFLGLSWPSASSLIRVKIAEPYKDPAVIFLSDILLCSCPTSKMSCTTQPFLHRIALGKCTLLVPNNPWDLISAPLLTVHNLSMHFKTFQTNPSAYNHSRYEIGKGALARAGSEDPSYIFITFPHYFQKAKCPWWLNHRKMFNIFLLTNRQWQPFCYGQCFQCLGDPLNVIPEGDSNGALSYLAVLLG